MIGVMVQYQDGGGVGSRVFESSPQGRRFS